MIRICNGYALTSKIIDSGTIQYHLSIMNARQELLERGFIILYSAVPDEMVNNLRSVACHDVLPWNNGTWNGEAFDPLRTRARLPGALCRVLTFALGRHYLTFFPHATVTEWSALRTVAGAADQPIRRDFAPPLVDVHAADLSALPGSLMVATQDDTVIYGYGWNRLVALRSNAQMIQLNKGDLIMFWGDFMYAHAGYETNNLLVHGYLDTPFYQRALEGDQPELAALIDDVSAVDDLFCYVHNCPFVASGTTSLRKHLNRRHAFFFSRTRIQNT